MSTRKIIAIFFLLSFVFLIAGCETTRAIATGIEATTKGIAKDTKGLAKAIMALDDWIKRNLW
ncbi:MAG: hypothetical protein NC928_04915 [Candidatus Omnitrophica bacterium]|nr:hypothetical protein [Candidatus Omnitrophota bacterium]